MQEHTTTVPREIRDLLAARKLPEALSERAIRFALSTSLESLLIEECESQGVLLSGPDVQKLFAQSLMRSSHAQRSLGALTSFVEIANSVSLHFSVFKGAALAYSIYDRPAARTFNDVDILLADNDPVSLTALLTQLGRSSKSSQALIELVDKGRPIHEVAGVIDGIPFDLHFNPFGLVTPMRANYEIFSAASSAQFTLPTGQQVNRPSVELHLLIVLVNLCRRGGGALRFYADASRLLASTTFDWPRFWDLAEREGLVTIANQALLSLQHDLGLDVDVAPNLSRAWWGPHIAERPTAERALRRPPLLALRLKPHLASDVASLLSWYVPGRVQRQARFG